MNESGAHASDCTTEETADFAVDLHCAGGGTRTHTRLPSPDFFESDKDCAMVRDAALWSAFMSLFALLCGIERVLVRPDCHQRRHQSHLDEAWLQEGPYRHP